MEGTIAPETIIALALLKALELGKDIRVEDISALFAEGQTKGLNVEEIALRRVPGGFYSEDVEAFAGRLFAAGYATARSPITLQENGVRVCREIIEEELKSNPGSLRDVAKALRLEEPLASIQAVA